MTTAPMANAPIPRVPQAFPAFGRRPWVMGIVNVTPDSFSDGGRWADTAGAVARGLQLTADGAAIVDIGGESTRPGAHRVDAETELSRVIPVITELAAAGVLCSVDTTRARVAAAALAAGAAIVNDVSGGMADSEMPAVVADAGVPWILMHWRGHSDVMAGLADYSDVLTQVRDELLARVDAALAAGVDERSLIIDPGLGFAKNAGHNWDLLRGLDALVRLGLPVLLGASRKRFIGELLADSDGTLRPPAERDAASAAITVIAAQRGVWGVRVHEPLASLDACAVVDACAGGEVSDRIWAGQPLVAADAVAGGAAFPVGSLQRPAPLPVLRGGGHGRMMVRRRPTQAPYPRLPVRRGVRREPPAGPTVPSAGAPPIESVDEPPSEPAQEGVPDG